MQDPTPSATPVTLSLDPGGFYLCYSNQHQEVEFLDTSLVRDARTGKSARTPRDGRLRQLVTMGAVEEALEEKTVTVVFGTDFVNVQFLNFVCGGGETARVSAGTRRGRPDPANSTLQIWANF